MHWAPAGLGWLEAVTWVGLAPCSGQSSISMSACAALREGIAGCTQAGSTRCSFMSGIQRRNQIFVLGLPKTGTSSLHEALLGAGVRSCHSSGFSNPLQFASGAYLGTLDPLNTTLVTLCSALGDVPWYALALLLLHSQPHARFILTRHERGCGEWVEHMRGLDAWASQHPRAARWEEHHVRDFHECFFGGRAITEQTKPRYVQRCEDHEKNVMSMAHALGRRLLVLPVEWPDAAKWEAVIRFIAPSPSARVRQRLDVLNGSKWPYARSSPSLHLQK